MFKYSVHYACLNTIYHPVTSEDQGFPEYVQKKKGEKKGKKREILSAQELVLA